MLRDNLSFQMYATHLRVFSEDHFINMRTIPLHTMSVPLQMLFSLVAHVYLENLTKNWSDIAKRRTSL
jgi:hypothetical protein